MKTSQFRVLYWQSLFRVVDLDLLSASAQGDASKLLGQLAGILIYISFIVAFAGLISGMRNMAPAQKLAASWAVEQFLISTTMLVVGLFAVLSWEAMFPDRRDVMVVAPLPIRSCTLFLAKASAVIAALLVAVFAFNGAPSLIWPIMLPSKGGLIGVLQCFGAYWLTMLVAGTFTFASLLCVQGLAALLPRQKFLRLSGFLQVAAFCLLLSGYSLLPTILTARSMAAAREQILLAWAPPYWFWSLFQMLNGASDAVFAKLAWRAAAGLAVTILGAAAAFLLSYLRTLRKISEEPDIMPATRSGLWLPRLGPARLTAIVHFSARTLFRSRQHRLILSFFFGLAFAILILCLKGPPARNELAGTASWRQPNAPLIAASIVMMSLLVIGIRVAFTMPTELRANWIFRTADFLHLKNCLKATRRLLFALVVAPVCIIWAVPLFWLWPWQPAAQHLVLLALLGAILVEAGLYGFHKIPFTCSYLPGKANIYVLVLICAPFAIPLLIRIVMVEQNALQSAAVYSVVVTAMAFAVIAARWSTAALARSEGAALRFEEIEPPEIEGLQLTRDL